MKKTITCKNIYFSIIFVLINTLLGCQLEETNFIQPTPVALEATNVTSTSFRARWKPVLGSSTYLLDVSTDPNFTYFLRGYQSLEVQDTALLVTNLDVDQEYYYRVRAKKGNTFSGNSNVIITNSQLLPNPVALEATQKKVLQFTAQWNTSEGATSYLLDVSSDPEFATLLPEYSARETVDTSLVVQGLDFRKTYYYRIRAKRLHKLSNYSNVKQVLPVITSTCKLSRITYPNFGIYLQISYDVQGRLSHIAALVEQATIFTYNIVYDQNNLPTQVTYQDPYGEVTRFDKRIYNRQQLLSSVEVYENADLSTLQYVKDYLYNTSGQAIGIRIYSDKQRTTLIDSQDYQLDKKGNPVKIFRSGDLIYSFKYDNEFNPFLMIRQDLCEYLVIQDWEAYTGLQINNPIVTTSYYLDNQPYVYNSVANYEFNDRGVPVKKTDTYNIDYEFTDCSF